MMMNPIRTYLRWLHTQWPAGGVERLPVVREDGSTNVTGLYVVGDLRGVPLLKFAADSGARAIRAIADNLSREKDDVVDVAIIGAGVAGMAAALESRRLGLSFVVFEANEPFSTIVNFPRGKPIYTYPREMDPAGDLTVTADVKERLVEELRAQTVGGPDAVDVTPARVEYVRRAGNVFAVVLAEGAPADAPVKARFVVCALGRSGNFRRLDIPGEHLDKVYNRLHDPRDFAGQSALVVGGGDSALETAIALARCGGDVTLSYRKESFARPKPENVAAIDSMAMDRQGDGAVRTLMNTAPREIREGEVEIASADGTTEIVKNDVVFSMIGREPPLEFFRRSGVAVAGDRGPAWWGTLALMLAVFTFLYHWKKGGTWLPIAEWFQTHNWFPHFVPDMLAGWGTALSNPANLLGTLRLSMGSPGFWFSVLYTALIVVFGIKRIRRRGTPYVRWQTVSLMAVQVVPLFLLPYLVLPWLGHLGAFDAGAGKAFADALFPEVTYDPQGREYWRAFGLILAWPLFLWNVFSGQPMLWWLVISFVQTFVLIPLGIYFWGKGVYCGWVCSCGAMAETLGDTHRHKMPHGPAWNRANAIGQVFLAAALLILVFRIISWASPGGWAAGVYNGAVNTSEYGGVPVVNYAWFVDLFWAGILGFGLYFHFSGRVWCRFACPLAALMHVFVRFSRFRIIADKKKCISCNVCTSVCHQGIDIMNFANKGLHMSDPECVRCSACVQSCPTGVLSFGQVDRDDNVIATDTLAASPVRTREGAAG